ALIGAIPVGLFAWPKNYPSLKTTASVDGVPTIIDGVPTLAGWLGYLQTLGMFAAFGAVGGLVFWLTLRWSGVLTDADPDAAKPSPPPHRHWTRCRSDARLGHRVRAPEHYYGSFLPQHVQRWTQLGEAEGQHRSRYRHGRLDSPYQSLPRFRGVARHVVPEFKRQQAGGENPGLERVYGTRAGDHC